MHGGEANARLIVGGQATPVVADGQVETAVLRIYHNSAVAGLGMADGVGHRFQRDVIGGNFDGGGQAGQGVLGGLDGDG